MSNSYVLTTRVPRLGCVIGDYSIIPFRYLDGWTLLSPLQRTLYSKLCTSSSLNDSMFISLYLINYLFISYSNVQITLPSTVHCLRP